MAQQDHQCGQLVKFVSVFIENQGQFMGYLGHDSVESNSMRQVLDTRLLEHTKRPSGRRTGFLILDWPGDGDIGMTVGRQATII